MKTAVVILSEYSRKLNKYIGLIAKHAGVRVYWYMLDEIKPFPSPSNRCFDAGSEEENVNRLLDTTKIDFAVIEYSENNSRSQRLFDTLCENDIPVVALKIQSIQKIKRILLPTCGGQNTSGFFWFVRLLAEQLQLPIHLLHVRRSKPEQLGCRSIACGVMTENSTVSHYKECFSNNISHGIIENIRNDDLVIIGSPKHYQSSQWFNESIPYKVLNSGKNVIMLQTKKPKDVNIRDVIWDELVKHPMTASSKTDAIKQLVQQLADNGQIAQGRRDEILKLFLNREKLYPTGVGQGVAFPHIMLPGFWGLVSCVGICPDGVSFSDDARNNIKIIFLTISSPVHRSEYLNFLSQVARKMIDKKTRNELLESQDSTEILNTLQSDY